MSKNVHLNAPIKSNMLLEIPLGVNLDASKPITSEIVYTGLKTKRIKH